MWLDARRLPHDVLHRAILLLPPSRRAGRGSRTRHSITPAAATTITTSTAHHDVTWSGAALGLFLHSLLNGVALAASVANSHGDSTLAGLGTFLVDLPPQAVRRHDDRHADGPRRLLARLAAYDQRARSRWRFRSACWSFTSVSPSADGTSSSLVAAYALAFSAGTFLCIASSDLLPELQFHQHDRVKLSAALLLGLAIAVGVAELEEATSGPHLACPFRPLWPIREPN